MTAASFAADMIGGGGKYAAVFHIAGMPWAVTTSTELVAALADPNAGGTNSQKQQHMYRRRLFGERHIAVLDHYPSDHVQIIPSLDPSLGKQTVTYDESKGLTSGGWSVKFNRTASGAEYSHFRSGGVDGTYDGLDVMPDPTIDASVKTGILYANWNVAGSTIAWYNDKGLYDLVLANNTAGNPTYVWVQSSCIGLRAPVDNADGTFTATAFAGCLRTPREILLVGQEDHGSHMIVSAPATTIVGRPAILYWVPMTADGDIVDIDQTGSLVLTDYTKPIKIWDGPVKPNPTCGPEKWKVDCGWWFDFWNVDIPQTTVEGELRGYRLHRPPALADANVRPHLSIRQWHAVTAAYVFIDIWLCAAGASVYFANKTAMAVALWVEMTYRNFSAAVDAEDHNMHVEYGKFHDNTPVSGYPTTLNGPCAWILQLGRTPIDISDPSFAAMKYPPWETVHCGWTAAATTHGRAMQGWLMVDDDENADEEWGETIPSGMNYYYGYNWRSVYQCDLGWDTSNNRPWPEALLDLDYYPVPYHTAAPRYRLSIKHDFDTTLLEDASYFTLGSGDTLTKLYGKVESTASNYIEVSDNWIITPTRQMKSLPGSSPDALPIYWSQPLYYWPALHDSNPASMGDPFRLKLIQSFSDTKLSKLFRGILGDVTNGTSLPLRIRTYHTPDLYDDTLDMRDTVDWDQLDSLTSGTISGVIFLLQLDSSQNVLKLWNQVLLHLGVRPVWGYIESYRGFGITFEPFGESSPSKAQASGRVFDNSNLIPEKPSGVYGNTWLYNHVNVKFNYDGDKATQDHTIKNVTGRAMLSSGNKMLKIDDKITQIPAAGMGDHWMAIKSILSLMNSAQPTVSARGTPTSMPLIAVGADCLFTGELIYDLYKGARGVTRRPGMMTSATTSISVSNSVGKMDFALKFRLAQNRGTIGPSLRLVDANMIRTVGTVAVTALATDPANNSFADIANSPNGLTDLSLFGCIDYNAATDARKLRACSCDEYAVIIVDENATTWITAGAHTNVWHGRLLGSITDTLTLADVAAGECRITLDAEAGEFHDNTNKIVFFEDRDDADLQACQYEVYGWNGDEDGIVTDADAAESQGMTWGV